MIVVGLAGRTSADGEGCVGTFIGTIRERYHGGVSTDTK
jgi:molybdopterin synthase catalytic subunit